MKGRDEGKGWRKGRREGQLSDVQLSTRDKAAGTLFISMAGRPSPTRHKQKTPSACLSHSTVSSYSGLWCLLESKIVEPTDIQILVLSNANLCFYKYEQNSFNTFQGRKPKAGVKRGLPKPEEQGKAQLPQPIIKD